MAKVFYDKDANLDTLKDKTIAVIGFGNQGSAQAQNLKDNGLNVIIAEVDGTPNWEKAKALGFEVMDTATASQRADIIQVLIPDELQAGVYKSFIKRFMKKGKTLMFSHGFNIHFKAIKAPKDVNVIMVAPKGPGYMVRETFIKGAGVPCLIAVHHNATGDAKEIALAYAKGIGGTRAGVFETTFKEEVETDLFGEQTVLCGGCTSLVKNGFETLVEAGYQPEMAYFECVHELKLIVDLIYKSGIAGMRKAISNTAEYGDLSVGPKIVDEKVKKSMKKALAKIQSGKFAREWLKENKNGCKNFQSLREKDLGHPLEKVGAELRDMMAWMKDASKEQIQL